MKKTISFIAATKKNKIPRNKLEGRTCILWKLYKTLLRETKETENGKIGCHSVGVSRGKGVRSGGGRTGETGTPVTVSTIN